MDGMYICIEVKYNSIKDRQSGSVCHTVVS